MLRIPCVVLGIAACAGAQTAAVAPDTEDPKQKLPILYQSIVITASPVEPQLERRNEEVFKRTLFSRDDQVFHLLAAGIDAGQHEGGGKSIEVRRFGFNLDHGGVNGGLKVLIDNIQQNQTTQGHGQGYLGGLKTLSPELVQEVSLINGPFSAEYGDFSGLGVVHIRLRDTLPDEWTARVQGGSFGMRRGFLAYSPMLGGKDAFIAYDGSTTDGPFHEPLRYRRDNVTANLTSHLSAGRSIGLKFNGGRNTFNSSGQIPLDQVAEGRLSPFGFIDPTDGGDSVAATTAGYFKQESGAGRVLRADGFVSRSLLDLYSNFTFYLTDPVNGDAFQQHDSRLVEGANVQYIAPQRLRGASGLLTMGANLHANQINVSLYPRIGREPLGVATRHHANISNLAGYAQDVFTFLDNRLQLGGGIRYDIFGIGIRDRLTNAETNAWNGLVQPKLTLAYTPSHRLPATLHANYGRGISSTDARSVAKNPNGRHVATTDFYQVGTSHQWRRVSASTDLFLIDRSNELVYVADDGSLEFMGPSRAYGFELKTSFDITRSLTLYGGLTKVLNAFYRGTTPRVYVDRAPHMTANAGLTLAYWRGWSGSLRMRAINHYSVSGEDPILAMGHTVFDLNLSRRVTRAVDFGFGIDNLTDRLYYETQNYFVSRLQGQQPAARIHGTPGYPLTVTAGLTFRFGSK